MAQRLMECERKHQNSLIPGIEDIVVLGCWKPHHCFKLNYMGTTRC